MSQQQSPIWESIFDRVIERSAPADPAAIEQLFRPISPAEIASITAQLRNPWPVGSPLHASYKPLDPSKWVLPRPPLPREYIEFLVWSNGACWETGDREFACFGCEHMREYLLHYEFPEYMPGAMPIGLDGGGVFGVFDLRNGPSDLVWAIGAGALSWDGVVLVAESFIEFCRGQTPVGDVYYDGLPGRLAGE
jgi:hypothetical protein